MNAISVAVSMFIAAHLYVLLVLEILVLPLIVIAVYAVHSKGTGNRFDRNYLDPYRGPKRIDRRIAEIYARDNANPNPNYDRSRKVFCLYGLDQNETPLCMFFGSYSDLEEFRNAVPGTYSTMKLLGIGYSDFEIS